MTEIHGFWCIVIDSHRVHGRHEGNYPTIRKRADQTRPDVFHDLQTRPCPLAVDVAKHVEDRGAHREGAVATRLNVLASQLATSRRAGTSFAAANGSDD